MEALVRVNGGVRVNVNGRWSGSMGVLNNGGSMGALKKKTMKRALVSVNGGIEKGSKGALVRVNGGMEKGQVRQGLGLGQTGVWLWVRQGCGCGSDRRLFYRVVSSTLQGCKLYLAGLQALPCRVASSTLQGCKLYLAGL